MDGPALYRALQARQHPAHKRVLFVTGDTLSRHTLEFLESARVPFLAKPFLVEELKLAVEKLWPSEGAEAASPRATRPTERQGVLAAREVRGRRRDSLRHSPRQI
jgi:DNA-binding response OmpR family regulator